MERGRGGEPDNERFTAAVFAAAAKFEMTSDADYSACLVSINRQGDAFSIFMCCTTCGVTLGTGFG